MIVRRALYDTATAPVANDLHSELSSPVAFAAFLRNLQTWRGRTERTIAPRAPMEATVFAQLESFEDSDDRKSVSQEFFLCSPEPFAFTHLTKEQDIASAFAQWLDTAIAVAFKEYGTRL